MMTYVLMIQQEWLFPSRYLFLSHYYDKDNDHSVPTMTVTTGRHSNMTVTMLAISMIHTLFSLIVTS